MAKTKRMNETEIAAAVDGQISDARNYDGGDRKDVREWALRFFEGEVDFPAMGKNRSTVVSRDVADTHGLILPGLLRAFLSTDRVALYEPTRKHMATVEEEDPETGAMRPVEKDVSEDRADQATDLVNYVVLRECDGYRQLRNAISDGLLLGNGPVKHWWDDTPEYHTDEYKGLNEDEAALVKDDTEIEEIFDEEEYPDPDWKAPPPIDPATLPPDLVTAAALGVPDAVEALKVLTETPKAPTLWKGKVKRKLSSGRLRLLAMPNEELLIDRNTIVLDETCRFAAHKQRVMRSDLIKEGFDRKKVMSLPAATSTDAEPEKSAREDGWIAPDNAPDKATEYVDRYECYILLDADGDGIAERRKIVMAGGLAKRHILSNEEWTDDLPFSDIVPDPRPHTWRGRGLYDEMADVQRVKTVGLRGLLDNTYQQLVPQREMEAGAYKNPDEVYNPTFGGVLLRETGKAPMTTVQIPYIGDKVFPLLEYMDALGEKRTGASQRTQALDVDALQNQSATAVNAMQAATYSKIEEYARNIAECGGLKRIFACCYRLIVTHQDRAKTVRLRGKWVEIDPRGWASDMDVQINTGLGTGSRERDIAMLSAVKNDQAQAVAVLGGPFNPILNIGHIFETSRKTAEIAGVRNADGYFPVLTQDDIAKIREQQAQQSQGQPNPAMIEAQARIAADQAKAQADMELRMAEAAADAKLAQQKAAAEIETQRMKAAAQIEIEQMKARSALQLRREEMQLEAELTRQANMLKNFQGSAAPADVNINGAV